MAVYAWWVLWTTLLSALAMPQPPAPANEEPTATVERRPVAIDGDAEIRESFYYDSDHTQVSTTSVDATVVPGRIGLTLRGEYLADVISSASIDVVSAATGRWEETRHQASGGVTFERELWTADAGYTFSDENDWTSHTANVSLGRDFLQRNTNVTAGYVYVHNRVFRADDSNFRDQLQTHAVNLTVTQVLGKKTNFRVSGFFADNRGYQSSPYRFVPVGTTFGTPPDPAGTCAGALACPLERHPHLRQRYAVAPTVIQYAPIGQRPGAFLATYRLYGDSWQILSHTLELAYRLDLARWFQVRVRSRTYFQDKAFFYQERYSEPLTYLSVDREVSTFIHQLSGIKLTYKSGLAGPFDDIRIDVKADVFYFKFFNFVRLPSRVGGIAEIGLRILF